MQQNENPKKRPLLTAEQLQLIRRVGERTNKVPKCEAFEKLFRPPVRAPR